MFDAFGLALLDDFVRHVIGIGPSKQVRWIYARRVIATVKDVGIFGNGAFEVLIGCPVSTFAAFVNAANSVTIGIFPACPKPTTV